MSTRSPSSRHSLSFRSSLRLRRLSRRRRHCGRPAKARVQAQARRTFNRQRRELPRAVRRPHSLQSRRQRVSRRPCPSSWTSQRPGRRPLPRRRQSARCAQGHTAGRSGRARAARRMLRFLSVLIGRSHLRCGGSAGVATPERTARRAPRSCPRGVRCASGPLPVRPTGSFFWEERFSGPTGRLDRDPTLRADPAASCGEALHFASRSLR
jgi:hypothetical protein